MLVPSSFMQSMSAFVAQSMGAGEKERALKSLWYGISVSVVFGILMFLLAFLRGDFLARIFTDDRDVIESAFQHLKAYGFDCLETCFLFCFIGFFNRIEKTAFVMVQGLAGAFGVRILVAFLMSRQTPVSLFHIGLATPCAICVQIILCLIKYRSIRRREFSRNQA